MNNRYILFRHGQTKYQQNNLDVLYSKEDHVSLPITEEGEKQVEKSVKELKNIGIDIIYSSDFYRTRQTSEIAAREIGAEIISDKRLRDMDMGIFKGRPADEYRNFFEKREDRFWKNPPGGENWRDVKKRIVEFIGDMEKKYKNKTILVVSHGDPLWLLMSFFKNLTEKEILDLKHSPDFYPETGRYFITD